MAVLFKINVDWLQLSNMTLTSLSKFDSGIIWMGSRVSPICRPLTMVSADVVVTMVVVEELLSFFQFFLVLQSSVLQQRNLFTADLHGPPNSSLLWQQFWKFSGSGHHRQYGLGRDSLAR